MRIVIGIYRLFICYLGMILLGGLHLFLFALSLGNLRRFNAEAVSPVFCRCMLFLIGIKVEIQGTENISSTKTIYMFNHNSFLDIFILPLLKLPKTRIIISKRTKKIIPLYMSNIGLGSFFLPFKDEPKNRVEFFKNLSVWLLENDESIICAPEGVHTFRHGIAKFNRGVFHLALVSHSSITPIFLRIPKESNPLESYFFSQGKVVVSVLPSIETSNWKFESLETHIKAVRSVFVDKFNREFGETIQ